MKPEWHIEWKSDGCYQFSVNAAQKNGRYIKASLSKEYLGYLLQGAHVCLLFLNNNYELQGVLDIELTDDDTNFAVSDKLNNYMQNK